MASDLQDSQDCEIIDYIIIGTGFVGSIIANFLEETARNYKIIEPSLLGKSAFGFGAVIGVFDSELALKTIGIGGGANVWGNGLTLPTMDNFFSDDNCKNWQLIYRHFDDQGIDEFRRDTRNNGFKLSKRDRRKVSKIIDNKSQELLFEKHLYAGGTFGSSGWNVNIEHKASSNLLKCDILSITPKGEAGHHRLSVKGENGTHQMLSCRKLIFASGTLMNAFLVYLATGKQRFPLGNHFSAILGTVKLDRPRSLAYLLQSWENDEKSFLTVSLSKKYRKELRTSHSALRFHPLQVETIGSRWQIALSRLARSPRNGLKLSPWFSLIRESLYYLFTHKQLHDSFQIHIMVDVPLTMENFIQFEDSRAPIAASVNLQFTPESLNGAKYLLESFHSKLLASGSCVSLKIPTIQYQLFNKQAFLDTPWFDTAHYFGTIPMSDDDESTSINDRFELNSAPDIFVIGNSSIPTGSHGHPTMLAVLLAKTFCAQQSL